MDAIKYLFYCSRYADHIRYWLPTKALNNEKPHQQVVTVEVWRPLAYNMLIVSDLSIRTSVLADNGVPPHDGDLEAQV
jgi:hypothetical protein